MSIYQKGISVNPLKKGLISAMVALAAVVPAAGVAAAVESPTGEQCRVVYDTLVASSPNFSAAYLEIKGKADKFLVDHANESPFAGNRELDYVMDANNQPALYIYTQEVHYTKCIPWPPE
ncbi:hypothetical protein PV371_38715 [Streptomyces sp. TX20-6-3]|uniref:hypothetical protein n=1 Tax=Streptomyces sp. TX20-6-3 TaxID=3028705 RepID=UPI0029B40D49|nr:hypothetical protein [Streptomyces sp. TX20-6-3]MDX2565448.1 hypothetical protein [Streptomyces sp. TX20-6-3]